MFTNFLHGLRYMDAYDDISLIAPTSTCKDEGGGMAGGTRTRSCFYKYVLL